MARKTGDGSIKSRILQSIRNGYVMNASVFIAFLLLLKSDYTIQVDVLRSEISNTALAAHFGTKAEKPQSNSNIWTDKMQAEENIRHIKRRKRHISGNSWPHKCINKTSETWKRVLPVIYECIPTTFLRTNFSSTSVKGTGGNISPSISSPTDGSLTTRTVRYIGSLFDAKEQFGVPLEVTDLRLWYQGIISIEDNAFEVFKQLKSLKLSSNEISYLSQGAFHGLSNLVTLDLSYNRLQAIRSFIFIELKSLSTLNLQFNEIGFIQNSLFCGLAQISNLDLSYNVIADVDKHALRHFRASYGVTIDLSNNKLKTPKKEWLMLGPDSDEDPNCKPHKGNTGIKFQPSVVSAGIPKFNRNPDGMEIKIQKIDNEDEIVVKTHETSHFLPPFRHFKAFNNPWECTCDSELSLIEFTRLYNSIFTALLNGGLHVRDNIKALRELDYNGTKDYEHMINITDPKSYANWYFDMPCENSGASEKVDLGRLTLKQQGQIEKTCCNDLSESDIGKKIIKNDDNLKKLCKNNSIDSSSNFTENHVTIIGIVIVFSTPILLTLCPDCNRSVSPTSTGGGVTSGGKFGTVSLNANNNKDIWKSRSSERRPFDNERFCLVVQEEKKDPRTFYIAEVV